MAKFTPYALSILPTASIDVNGIYFIKASATTFNIYVRKEDNSDWYNLGVVGQVTAINALSGAVQLDLSLSATGVLSLTGGTQTIDLDGRYRKNADTVDWSDVSNAPSFALDGSVVHNTTDETIAGVKTFTSSPIVPDASAANQTASKGQVDTAISGLQTQINTLSNSTSSALIYKGTIDCSANPNYPAAAKGDTYIVSIAGKIGGASGTTVEAGNSIICNTDNSGGTQATVGADFDIIQSNQEQATESVSGVAKIATTAQVTAGSDDATIVTPLKLAAKIASSLSSQTTTNNATYVRFDAAQTLTSGQKTQVQSNIGAASSDSVVDLSNAQSVAGIKTFTSIPVLPGSDPTTNNQAVRKQYVDTQIINNVSWGGVSGKEW